MEISKGGINLKKYEDECLGCTTLGIPCHGSTCVNRNVPRYYCDRCKDEFEPEELYISDDGDELCADCFLMNYRTVKEMER